MKKILLILLIALFSCSLFANIDETIGNIRFVVENYSGNVTIYRLSEDGNFVSLFDSKTFTKSPTFFVYYDGAVLPVDASGGFKITSSIKDTQAVVTSVLKNKLELTTTYDLFSSNSENIIDSVKVSTVIKNLSENSHEVALKAFFDTWLGENTDTHFTTALQSQITTEKTFINIKNDKWVQSANLTDVIRFLVPENQIHSIDNITVANKFLLSQLNWYYITQPGKEFHSINSYNNSALAITWNKFILGQDVSETLEFYMLTGETSVTIPAIWPPVDAKQESSSISELYKNLSPEELQRIREILAAIDTLKDDSSYLSEQEIISLSAEVDSILNNAGR